MIRSSSARRNYGVGIRVFRSGDCVLKQQLWGTWPVVSFMPQIKGMRGGFTLKAAPSAMYEDGRVG